MTHHTDDLYDYEEKDSGPGFFSGLLIGGLIGAVAAILTAPNSGEETRMKLREKGIELKDQFEQAASDLQGQAQRVSHDVQSKSQQMMDKAESVVEQKREQVERTAQAAKDTWKANEPVKERDGNPSPP